MWSGGSPDPPTDLPALHRLPGRRRPTGDAELLDLPEPPDAVFAANNLMGVGALQVLPERGLAPPAFGLAVFGDLPFTLSARRASSSVRSPGRHLGVTAARAAARAHRRRRPAGPHDRAPCHARRILIAAAAQRRPPGPLRDEMDFCHRTAMRDDGTVAAPATDRSSTSWTGPRVLGPEAAAAAFPLGGIGTGNVSIGARGELRDWEISQPPRQGHRLPFTFFAIRACPRRRRVRHPGARARIAAAARGRLRPPHRQGRRTAALDVEPDARRVPAADDRVRRRRRCRSR